MSYMTTVQCPSCTFIFSTDKKGTVNCPKKKGGCGHKLRVGSNLIDDTPKKEQKEQKKEQIRTKKNNVLDYDFIDTLNNNYLNGYRSAYNRAMSNLRLKDSSETVKKYKKALKLKIQLEEILK
ncbi:MAG: hypothetical protein GY853_00990 [PVC group bacterium]|nr:hypothetical protein [PVC group bacterium]